MKPHKHAELIIAWAKGAQIQTKNSKGEWLDQTIPNWFEETEYRIKPREFIEGRWYPIYTDGLKHVCVYSGGNFWATKKSSGAFVSPGFFTQDVDWIGEPLPEIEWPEDTE